MPMPVHLHARLRPRHAPVSLLRLLPVAVAGAVCILALALAPARSLAQRNFVPAVVVTVQGDTLRGQIDYRNWRKNPSSVAFRADSTAPMRRLGPSDIRRFRASGDRYVSRRVSIDQTPHEPQNLAEAPSSRRDRVFLQLYVEGRASLYYYLDEVKEHFYLRSEGPVVELVRRRLKGYRGGEPVMLNDNQYRHQLRQAFADCPGLAGTFDDLAYGERELVGLFEDYNRCAGAEVTYTRERERVRARFSVAAGLTTSQPALDHFLSGTVDSYGRSTNPALGLGIDVVFPRNRGRWSVYNELAFARHRAEDREREQYSVAGNYLKLSNMVRFRPLVEPVAVFAEIGAANALALSVAGHSQTQDDRGYLSGYLAGMGVETGAVRIEVRYEWTSARNRNNNYFYYLRSASLVVGVGL